MGRVDGSTARGGSPSPCAPSQNVHTHTNTNQPTRQGDPLAGFAGLLDGLDDGAKADILGLDAENGLIRSVLSGAINDNFLSAGLPSLLRCVGA